MSAQTTVQTAAQDERRRGDARAPRKPSNRERQHRERHEAIEREIESVEAELAVLTEQISAAAVAEETTRVDELSREYQRRDVHLAELWAEWERLGEQLA